uniref:Uncharacterized protein n=1 Tax=Ackermannviridae sp. TaxID=2831612 RepID=A0A8S5VLM3_9CAUD|nr:MAG TPA: hypothetical protein [Ackermannviridae sp.]
MWPLGLEADGPSPIVRGGFQTDTRTVKLKISKFYFFLGNLCYSGYSSLIGGICTLISYS